MTIYVWDTSAMRNIGTILPPNLGDAGYMFLRQKYMREGMFWSHVLVKEELKPQYEKNRDNDNILAEGIRRAYLWVKEMEDMRLLRRKNDPFVLKLVSKMINLDTVLHEKKLAEGLTEEEKVVKDFINNIIMASKRINAGKKEPADLYVIATAIALGKERGDHAYVVADDKGMKVFIECFHVVEEYIGVGTEIDVIGYKDFLEREGLRICLQQTGPLPEEKM